MSSPRQRLSLILSPLAIGFAVAACGGSTGTPDAASTTLDVPLPSIPPVGSSPATTPTSSPALSPEALDASTYESLTPRDFALLVKDPDVSTGRKVIVSGRVTQFDASTGPSGFRADTGSDPQDVRANGVNSIVNAPDPTILANVVKDDRVTMWCQVQGTETYDDVMGGKMTVPVFSVYILKENGS